MGRSYSPATLNRMKSLGLRIAQPESLTIERCRRGRRFDYRRRGGALVRDRAVLRRLTSLAVPPAYTDVFFAADPSAHLQAIGRDAAGRLQYRYHPDWQKVRDLRKTRRLARLIKALPQLRTRLADCLAQEDVGRTCVLAAVVETVARTAIRAGSHDYARLHGSRGATTLLKKNVTVKGATITFSFKGKLKKPVARTIRALRLAQILRALLSLPGPLLFQYRDTDGTVRQIRSGDVNAYLRELSGVSISLKDFRTLVATDVVLANLLKTASECREPRHKKHVRDAVEAAASVLANTPAVCRKSYVHEAVLSAI